MAHSEAYASLSMDSPSRYTYSANWDFATNDWIGFCDHRSADLSCFTAAAHGKTPATAIGAAKRKLLRELNARKFFEPYRLSDKDPARFADLITKGLNR